MRAKRWIGLFIVAVLGTLNGCKNSDRYVIGVSKILSHPALDAVERGLMKTVLEVHPEVEFDLQNANNEITAVNTIAQLFQNNGVKLAVGIATPSIQALVQQTSGIPLFYAGITSPEETGILSKPGTQITGYSDLTPVAAHVKMIQAILPEIKRLGQVYSSNEDNGVILNQMTQEAADSLGIELIARAVGSTAEVRSAALSFMDQVDAVYIAVDNQVISALPGVGDLAYQAKVPLFTADPSSAEKAKVVLSMGFDYFKMGLATGQLIVDYLEGREEIFEKPVRYLPAEDLDVYVDRDLAEELGLTIPDNVFDLLK